MKRLVLFALAITFGLSQVAAQETAPTPEEQSAMMQDMMKKAQELGSPGDWHAKLNPVIGTWDVETKMWMGGEGSGDPMVSKGTTSNSWILGGRYVRQDYKGEMMGQPFIGIGMTGYDNFSKKYVSTWIDDMSTMYSTMEGSVDRSGKVFTFYGKMHEWSTGELDKMVKHVLRITSDDKHVFEIHDTYIGEPNTKVLELTYTRRK
ncbi:MAG: DUF1579 domain-containing protein [Bacteroidota bacterium]